MIAIECIITFDVHYGAEVESLEMKEVGRDEMFTFFGITFYHLVTGKRADIWAGMWS